MASLLRRIEGRTLANTLLFVGPRGSGKKTLAMKVAQKLFCSQCCGQCPSCSMLIQGRHPDFLQVQAENDWIKLEQARQVKTFLASPPNSASHKIAILEECQRLTIEAGNSLLKVLEEPPVSSICILTADSTANVLPTLVSRSQVYPLSALSRSAIVEMLKKLNIRENQRQFLVGFSEGLPGRALALADDEDFWSRRQEMAPEILGVMAGHGDPLLFSERWCDYPESISLLEFWLRDMARLQISPDYTPVNTDFHDSLEACLTNCPGERPVVLLDHCARARGYLQARCNPRLVFDCLALQLREECTWKSIL